MEDTMAKEKGKNESTPKGELFKVDRNGTKYYANWICPKCGGTGFLKGCNHIGGGKCFDCNGTGRLPRPIIEKVYTEEYREKLDKQRKQKAQKKAEENLKFAHQALMALGFNDAEEVYAIPHTYLVLSKHTGRRVGDIELRPTLPDELNDEARKLVKKIKASRLTKLSKDNIPEFKEGYERIISSIVESRPDPTLKVGDKIRLDVCVESRYDGKGYGDKISHTYKLFDRENHKYVWETEKYFEPDQDATYRTVEAIVKYVGKNSVYLKHVREVKSE